LLEEHALLRGASFAHRAPPQMIGRDIGRDAK
jgi:hypothetical protein